MRVITVNAISIKTPIKTLPEVISSRNILCTNINIFLNFYYYIGEGGCIFLDSLSPLLPKIKDIFAVETDQNLFFLLQH